MQARHWEIRCTRSAYLCAARCKAWVQTVKKNLWAMKTSRFSPTCLPDPDIRTSLPTVSNSSVQREPSTTSTLIMLVHIKEPLMKTPQTLPRFSATFDPHSIAEIRRAAATGIYDIRGGGAKRKLPHFDDLLFLGASMSRYPLEGYRERCGTDVVLGN